MKLIIEKDLRGYFFEELSSINNKSGQIIPEEIILYSCDVLERLSTSEQFFELESHSGKLKEKVLGIKLLEAGVQNQDKKKLSLRDIGDTSLVVCGLFSEILNKKISDLNYYQNIGKSAYEQLDSLVPTVYDIEHFYRQISIQFELTVSLLSAFKRQGLERLPDRFSLKLKNDPSINKKAV